jgi:beta-mannosidase
LESFVAASQRAQAHGLRIAVEHYRRRKARGCGGVLIWQFNEPWPAISWALVDHYRQPKPAYEVVKRLFAPLLLSLDYPLRRYGPADEVPADVWIVNDLAETLADCSLVVTLHDESGQAANRFETILDVAADSALVVGNFRWPLPPGDSWQLRCQLEQGSQLLAKNKYDLAVHDGLRPTPGQRLSAKISDLVVPA